MSPRDLSCFVCDVAIEGKKFQLESCKTQYSKVKMWDKISELVGDQYVVFVSDTDVICRGCANLMNTVDRLEKELTSVKQVVLQFLERKYSLDENEVLECEDNLERSVPSQLPGNSRNVQHIQEDAGKNAKPQSHFSSNSLGQISAANTKTAGQETRTLDKYSHSSKTTSKVQNTNLWIQCDLCKYTTNYKSFMIYHIRQHMKKKTMNCDFCGDEVSEDHNENQANQTGQGDASEIARISEAVEDTGTHVYEQVESQNSVSGSGTVSKENSSGGLKQEVIMGIVETKVDSTALQVSPNNTNTATDINVNMPDTVTGSDNPDNSKSASSSVQVANLPSNIQDYNVPHVSDVGKCITMVQQPSSTLDPGVSIETEEYQTVLSVDDYPSICKAECTKSEEVFIIQNSDNEDMITEEVEMVEVWHTDPPL